MKYKILILISALLFIEDAEAQTVFKSEQAAFTLTEMATGLEHPWGLDFLPDGSMLVTERSGRLNLIRKNGQRFQISGLPEIADGGQGGLLDVLVHPDFKDNHTIFFSYSAGGFLEGKNTEVVRAKLNGTALDDVEVIFKAMPKVGGSNHFGSRLLIGPDEKLYITLGERFQMDEAQNPSNHLGAIVRINQDGSVPDDNPFVGRKGYEPEIYTYGHRNVQGIDVKPGTNEIWIHEHGPRGGDEVNILEAGANYGWPEITYGIDYSGLPITDQTHKKGMKQPVIYWDPSIAPSGMAFYTGNRFPDWKGDLFVGALVLQHLRRLEIDGNKVSGQEVLLKELGERIRDVVNGPDGYIYILTDNSEGRIIRLEPAKNE